MVHQLKHIFTTHNLLINIRNYGKMLMSRDNYVDRLASPSFHAFMLYAWKMQTL